jgi:hypothetical protein
MSIDHTLDEVPSDAFEVAALQDSLTGVYNAVVLWESPRDVQELLAYAGPSECA